jgi:MFS family permease
VIPMLLIDKFGRKVMFMISLTLFSFSLTGLGVYFHFKDDFGEDYVQSWKWVPLASLVSYIIACSIGIVPLSWVVMGEIMPPRAKGRLIPVAVLFFITLKQC